MKVPPKKTEEQIAGERQILAGLFSSNGWALYKEILREEMDGIYNAFPSYKSWEEVLRRQGYLEGLQKAHAMDANFKRT